ncbi:hypothetical protein B484DRAFT_417157, partial [Ochromonadaceae sp. CCMP2298]
MPQHFSVCDHILSLVIIFLASFYIFQTPAVVEVGLLIGPRNATKLATRQFQLVTKKFEAKLQLSYIRTTTHLAGVSPARRYRPCPLPTLRKAAGEMRTDYAVTLSCGDSALPGCPSAPPSSNKSNTKTNAETEKTHEKTNEEDAKADKTNKKSTVTLSRGALVSVMVSVELAGDYKLAGFMPT